MYISKKCINLSTNWIFMFNRHQFCDEISIYSCFHLTVESHWKVSWALHIFSHETLKHNWSWVQFHLVLNLKGLCSEYLALPKNRVEMDIHVQDFICNILIRGNDLMECYHHDLNLWPVAFECLMTENVKHPRNFSMWFHS